MSRDGTSSIINYLNYYKDRIDDCRDEAKCPCFSMEFALFLSVYCCKNKRGGCTYYNKSKYTQKRNYKGFKKGVSGPCATLFALLLGEKPESNISRLEYLEQAGKIADKYLGLDEEQIRKSSYEQLNIAIKKCKNKDLNKIAINKQLIDDCYEDVLKRISDYNEKEASRKPHDNTAIVFSVEKAKAEKTIKTLNREYEKAAKKDIETKEKLEKILLPVYCTSPYISICIVHHKQIPCGSDLYQRIKRDIREDNVFFFLIASLRYTISETGEYTISHKLLFNDTPIFRRDLVDLIEERCYLDRYSGYNVSDYQAMISRYTDLNSEITAEIKRHGYLPALNVNGSSWFPIELPKRPYNALSSLFNLNTGLSVNDLIQAVPKIKEEQSERIGIRTRKYNDAYEDVAPF